MKNINEVVVKSNVSVCNISNVRKYYDKRFDLNYLHIALDKSFKSFHIWQDDHNDEITMKDEYNVIKYTYQLDPNTLIGKIANNTDDEVLLIDCFKNAKVTIKQELIEITEDIYDADVYGRPYESHYKNHKVKTTVNIEQDDNVILDAIKRQKQRRISYIKAQMNHLSQVLEMLDK